MKFLILGGTALLGKQLVPKLVTAGHDVAIFSRKDSLPQEFSLYQDKIRYIRGDRNDYKKFKEILSQEKFDVVIDNINYSAKDTEVIIETFQNNINHYILCSSIAVYPDWNRTVPYREEEANLESIDRNITSNKLALHQYANSKCMGEKILQERKNLGFKYTIMRPAVIEGPGDYTNRTWYWVQRVQDGGAILVPEAKLQHVYVEDVANAMIAAAMNPVAYNKIYNLAGNDIILVENYVEKIAKILQKSIDTLLVTTEIAAKFEVKFPDLYDSSLLINNDKVKKDLNFEFTSIEHWLPTTVQWCVKNCKEISLGYQNRADEIQLYESLLSTQLRPK